VATVFPQTSNGQLINCPAGTHVGHILLSKHDCTFQGAGIDDTIIRGDGTYASVLQGAILADGGVSKATLVDMTIDADNLAAHAAVLESNGALLELVLQNVRILGTRRGARAILNRGIVRATDIEIIGSGGGIHHHTGATITAINGCQVEGSSWGFVNTSAGAAGTMTGITLTDFHVRHDFWASPTYEAVTVTEYGAQHAIVASHVADHRNAYDVLRALTPIGTFEASIPSPVVAGAQPWDRVEVSDGRWTQVLAMDGAKAVLDTWRASGLWVPVATPTSGTATVYRVSLGRLYGWEEEGERLDIATVGAELSYWRGVGGGLLNPELIAGSRLDILRHAYTGAAAAAGVRDVDTGGIHITDSAGRAVLRDCTVRGGFSDMITMRGIGGRATRCSVDLGQDMGFTIDGGNDRQVLVDCTSRRAGFNGFWLANGASELYRCTAVANGLHGDGGGYGVVVTQAAAMSHVDVRNYANRLGGTTREDAYGTAEARTSRADPGWARRKSWRPT
jgi:hypothetical protein